MRRRRVLAGVACAAIAVALAAWLVGAGDHEDPAARAHVRAHAAATDRSGRAFVAVERLDEDGRWRTAIAREAGDRGGRLDPTFAADVPVDNPRAIAVQAGGAMLVAGDRVVGGRRQLALARVNRDGSLDRRYGTNGVATVAAGSGDALARGLAVGARSGTVVVGDARAGDRHALAVAFFDRRGRRALVELVPDASAAGAAVDRNGSAIAGGTDTRDGSAVFVRVTPGPRLATTRARTTLTNVRWRAIAATPNGGAVLVGSGRGLRTRSLIAVQRFGPRGAPGQRDAFAAGDGDAFGTGVSVAPDRRVTVAGTGVRDDRPTTFVTTLESAARPSARGSGALVALLPESAILVSRWTGEVQTAVLMRR